MPRKTYRAEEIIGKLRQADVLLCEGKKAPEMTKTLGIREVTTTVGAKSTAASTSPRPSGSRSPNAGTPVCARRSRTSPSTS